ncbi:transcriptional regulator, TetR family [Halobacillus alkaliphilus]|uniref:Transcriptional regulator, TetR family n=1 Tax=Halobacillus alkaliphilus TaxID=396056 RepID=A0A1I2TLM3_9BACI|nr:TetR family transcriptional regulator [Halobacillus alkaliphilus]SFG64257.1 transcriptional regulator, TetR family [Halobacillus alkaliphilus]
MPKQTFFNLNDDKKNKLVEAAREEFSRVSLYEASIANILKRAEIPRGSFYQYFRDKEDAFFYLLNEHAEERHKNFIENLKAFNGDLFQAMTEVYKTVFQFSRENGNSNFIRNVLMNMNYKIEHAFTKNLTKQNIEHRFHDIYQLVDMEALHVSNEKEFYHLMQILIAVTFHNLVHCVSNEFSETEALDKYISELSLLKKGLVK